MSDEKRYATENTALGANSLAEVIKDWLAIDGSKFCLKVTNFILKIFENTANKLVCHVQQKIRGRSAT